MLTSRVMGRLCNQMFQLATTVSLAHDNNDIAAFPLTVECAEQPTHEERTLYTSTILSRLNYITDMSWVSNVISQQGRFCEYTPLTYQVNGILDGYFQSYRYFEHNREVIQGLFAPTPWVNAQLNAFYKQYPLYSNDEYVAIHVRRGDYVNKSHPYWKTHSNLAENYQYYASALKEFPNQKYVFFSDDINWCKQQFGDEHLYVRTGNDVLDLYIMSFIPNKIIANSSYSWWGAWLGEKVSDKTKTVAPKTWLETEETTGDLYMPTWDII